MNTKNFQQYLITRLSQNEIAELERQAEMEYLKFLELQAMKHDHKVDKINCDLK